MSWNVSSMDGFFRVESWGGKPAKPSTGLPGCHRRPIAFDPECDLCPVLAANRRRVVPGFGPRPSAIAWLGEAPGRLGADVSGVPFTRDRSGRRLQALLIRLGLSAESDPAVETPCLATFVTNLVRCNPPANRAPTSNEMESCAPFLRAELAGVRPVVIVTLGLLATRFALGTFRGARAQRMKPLHAQPVKIENRSWPRLIVPALHPARVADADWKRLEQTMARIVDRHRV